MPQNHLPDIKINEDDEVVVVTMPRADAEVLREMIDRQKSLSWIGGYVRNVLFVAAGGILTLLAFGDQIKKLLSAWIGS